MKTELAGTAVTPRFKVWFEHEGQVALSEWRVELLRAIDRCGSLAAAARELNVPYKTAWYKLKEVEANLGVPLLVTATGGSAGGSASLTPEARLIVQRYQDVVGQLRGLVEERCRQELLPLIESMRQGSVASRE